MHIELLAYTRPNPALNPAELTGVGDLATIWQGQSTYQENIIEFAGRVCYRSTHRMGTAVNFISARVREGHEDIIEHIVISLRVRGSDAPLRWRVLNRHCEVTQEADGSWVVSGNTRVWLDFLRRGIATDALPILYAIAPNVYAECANEAGAASLPALAVGAPFDLAVLRPAERDGMRVTLLGYTQPLLGDTESRTQHGSATFLFEGISRACTHQLVRHRLASFSQESQRYVGLDKGDWNAIIPPAIAQQPEARAKLDEAWNYLQETYQALREMGIRKEDARFLLPNAAETRIVATMNFAAWSHFLWLRAVDKAAQWEIRAMGQRVLEMLHAVAPDVYADHWRVYQEQFAGK